MEIDILGHGPQLDIIVLEQKAKSCAKTTALSIPKSRCNQKQLETTNNNDTVIHEVLCKEKDFLSLEAFCRKAVKSFPILKIKLREGNQSISFPPNQKSVTNSERTKLFFRGCEYLQYTSSILLLGESVPYEGEIQMISK